MGERKPNLIFINANGLRYQSLGFNGDVNAKTPNIDTLAQFSAVIDNCVSNHPLSSPFQASLFTGKYSVSTGIISEGLRINPNHKTFAQILGENGYSAEFIGDWKLYSDKNSAFVPQDKNRLGFDGYFADFCDSGNLFKSKYYLDSDNKTEVHIYTPDIQTDLASDRIETLSSDKKPFALFLSLSSPDSVLKKSNVPEKYYKMFDGVDFDLPENYDISNDSHSDYQSKLSKNSRKLLTEFYKVYCAMTANIDDNVGKIVSKTVELGIDDNTIIVFTSSYGEMFGSHGRKGKNIFYDEAVRVPFIIRYGERLSSGKNETCFGTVDIMPTLLGLMKIKIPETVQGKDKSSNLINGTSDSVGQLLMGTGPSSGFSDGKEWRAYRTKQFTYAVFKSDNEEMLFDNLNDPYQSFNLIYDKSFIDIGKRIKDEMYVEMARINDTFEHNSYYKDNWIKKHKVIVDLK